MQDIKRHPPKMICIFELCLKFNCAKKNVVQIVPTKTSTSWILINVILAMQEFQCQTSGNKQSLVLKGGLDIEHTLGNFCMRQMSLVALSKSTPNSAMIFRGFLHGAPHLQSWHLMFSLTQEQRLVEQPAEQEQWLNSSGLVDNCKWSGLDSESKLL